MLPKQWILKVRILWKISAGLPRVEGYFKHWLGACSCGLLTQFVASCVNALLLLTTAAVTIHTVRD